VSNTALEGVSVLEYANFVAGPYCARLLADLGAEVIKMESPASGDQSRKRGPYPQDRPHSETSGLFLYLNANKLGVTLDPSTSSGQRIFKEMVSRTDILIEDNLPQLLRKLGLDYSELKKTNSRLVMTSITPFGQSGPYRDYKAYYLNSYHASLVGYFTPEVLSEKELEREPLKIGGFLGEYGVGVSAALATTAALYYQWFSGEGQQIDISRQEAILNFFGVDAERFANWQEHPSRLRQLKGLGGMLTCRDGHALVAFNEEHQWRALVRIMGSPEWALDERYLEQAGRAEDDEQIMQRMNQWAQQHHKNEMYHRGQAAGCPIGPVWSSQEVFYSAQATARDYFVEIEHPWAGRQFYPSSLFRLSQTPSQVYRPAPLLGQHNEEVYCQRLGYSRQELTRMTQAGII
jgi:crotonobetainyl-CoA:carnitine CoA-transferase CaiB-like acyl-CoA transferase